MSKFLFLFCAGMLAGARLEAGIISGSVHAQGKAGTDSEMRQDGKYDSHQFKFVERIDYSAMHDFLVYIAGPVGGNPGVPEKPVQVATRRIAQKGAIFSPHVLPVVVGTTVEWPNYDDILHNVFSFSETKPFDLGLYKSPEIKRVTFDRPGRVDVFCSIHARMNCIIMVLENPFFAMTDEKGFYRISNVPPGKYQLRGWHERLPGQTHEVIVPPEGDVKVDFILGITNLPNL